jgi:hypothetical protein
MVAAIYLFVLPFVFGAAWWTTFRRLPSHKYWITVASLLNLVALGSIVSGNWRDLGSTAFLWAVVGFAVLGLAVFVVPWRFEAPSGFLPPNQESQSDM